MRRVELEQWRAREVARLLALVEAERRYYQEIVAAVPAGLAVVDSDLAFLSSNRAFRRVFGLSADRIVKFRVRDLFPGDEISEKVKEVIETESPRRNLPVQQVTESGIRALRVTIEPFRGWHEEASAEALILVEEDIRGPLPPAALAPSRQADDLLRNLNAIVWERDPASLRFLYVGGRTEEILGYGAERWKEPGFAFDCIHPGDRDWVAAFYRSTVSCSESRSCEYRALTADGRTVWLRDVIRVARSRSGAPEKLSGITVDIDSQKRQDEQLAQAEKMAALGRLAGKVTHDCNNLLMILSGYSEELLANLPPEHPSRGDVEEILAATDRLAVITDELLAFTRRPVLSPKVLNANSLVESLESQIRAELGKERELELDLDPGSGAVNADWDQLAESLMTLVRRAKEATPEGGLVRLATANTEFKEARPDPDGGLPAGEYVAVSVTDSGPRLDGETKTRLFEPFFAGGPSAKGLPNVYSVVRQSGGAIEVSDGPDGGATFTVYLPRAEEVRLATQRVPRNKKAAPGKPGVKPSETVLVVEDESGIRALMRKILRKQGYQVLEASQGEEALRIARGHRGPIHLLLTDVVMPKMSGRQLAEKLQAERPDVKVLFVSGYTDEDLAQSGPLPPGSAFLQKPFSLATLLDKTRAVLDEN